ncbi:MAG: dihydroorotase [Luminiphilus sp.]|jgi:dihydroorotase|nr:dihydroorotase [Luminiphilus sp.]
MTSLSLTLPDDWHIHLRDGIALSTTVPDVARWAGRAIVMPNLTPPVLNVADALSYRDRILAQVPAGCSFEPLMTLYLTDHTSKKMVSEAAACPIVHGIKLYPAGATTNSAAGVTTLEALYPVLEAMESCDVPLLIHGEVTREDCDIFDREKAFIDSALVPLVERFPALRVVFEHITTSEAVQFVMGASQHVAATVTAHHLLYNRNDLLVGGVKPHLFCLPVLKRDHHQLALRAAVTSGNSRFFLGTDSAPHTRHDKESSCGCAGCYTAHAALGLYTEVFDEENALDKLEAFASFNGPDFYRLPRNSTSVTLTKQAQAVPEEIPLGQDALIPIRAGDTVGWTVTSRN